MSKTSMLDKFKKEFKTIKEINLTEANNKLKEFNLSIQSGKKGNDLDSDDDDKKTLL